MKRFSEQLHKQSQTVKLKKSEQVDLRERIVAYMEYHPLPAAMKTGNISNHKTTTKTTILTETFAQYTIPYQRLFKFGGVAAVLVLIFIPMLAERTLPGDTLYAVKVQFNEELRSTLTWGSYQKVEWQTTLLNRRIAEARLLASEGLLTEAVEADVAAAVKEHSNNAKREIEVLRTSDADEAAIAEIAFDSSLSVQAQSFADKTDVVAIETEATRTGKLISDAIDESLAKPAKTEAEAVPAYDKLMARVEQNTTRIRDLHAVLEQSVSKKDLADLSRRIEDIDRAITEAVNLAAEESTELAARTALTDVVIRTQKLIIYMTELDVREQMTIEEVAPLVLTPNEMSTDQSNRTIKLTAASTKINAAIETMTNVALVDKLMAVRVQLTASLDRLTSLTDYEAFVIESDQSLALASDALALLEQAKEGTVRDPEPPQLGETSTTTATSTNQVRLVLTSTSSAATTTDVIATTTTESTQPKFDDQQ